MECFALAVTIATDAILSFFVSSFLPFFLSCFNAGHLLGFVAGLVAGHGGRLGAFLPHLLQSLVLDQRGLPPPAVDTRLPLDHPQHCGGGGGGEKCGGAAFIR